MGQGHSVVILLPQVLQRFAGTVSGQGTQGPPTKQATALHILGKKTETRRQGRVEAVPDAARELRTFRLLAFLPDSGDIATGKKRARLSEQAGRIVLALEHFPFESAQRTRSKALFERNFPAAERFRLA